MNDADFWKLIAIAAVGALAPLLGVIWSSLNKKIDEVRGIALDALTREEFERELKQSIRDRERLDLAVRDLFGKVEATRDLVNAKVESARESMSQQLAQLRTDMNGGFISIRDELRQWRQE